tara:strand:+ start:40873 stop:41358 length:486 start_codon:yes stop_codon:yes gene_type:complete
MANGIFNISLGRGIELHNRVVNNDPANAGLVVLFLKVAEADATLQDYATLGAILAEAGNTEADFTNYARKVLTDADISAAVVDNVNNRYEADIPDQTFVDAGGASNNTLVKLLVCYDPDTTAGDDTAIVPLAHLDYAETTTGSSIVAQINVAGYYRASQPA